MKKNLIAANPGGISNRLKCLISMLRISERYNSKLYMHWIRNAQCGAEFHRLFDNEFNMISKEELDKIEDKKITQTYRFITFPEEIEDGFAKVYPTKRGNNIDFEFNRIPMSVRGNIISYLERLKPIPIIKSVVEKFVVKHDVENLVGVHIRRGDFLDGKEGLGKVSSDNKFILRMKELLKDDPSTKFLLCTDCKETEDEFQELFKDKIIIYKKERRERTSRLATQQSLVDLLLLSKTNHIIGTYRSTFNEMAWWLGGCKAKVDIIIDNELNEQYEIKKEKMSRSKYLKLKKLAYKLLCKVRLFKK